jgi:hypothetical protein
MQQNLKILLLALTLGACSQAGEMTASNDDRVTIQRPAGTHSAAEVQQEAAVLCAATGKRAHLESMSDKLRGFGAPIRRYDFVCLV